MAQAFHIDVWTDQDEKRSYAAMAETREAALTLEHRTGRQIQEVLVWAEV